MKTPAFRCITYMHLITDVVQRLFSFLFSILITEMSWKGRYYTYIILHIASLPCRIHVEAICRSGYRRYQEDRCAKMHTGSRMHIEISREKSKKIHIWMSVFFLSCSSFQNKRYRSVSVQSASCFTDHQVNHR